MSELLDAAKAVIDAAESYKKDFAPFADEIRTLRAAVDQAYKPSADFMEWWKTFPINTYGIAPAFHGWEAGQQAERERIRARVMMLGKDWILDTTVQQYANALLEDGDE